MSYEDQIEIDMKILPFLVLDISWIALIIDIPKIFTMNRLSPYEIWTSDIKLKQLYRRSYQK